MDRYGGRFENPARRAGPDEEELRRRQAALAEKLAPGNMAITKAWTGSAMEQPAAAETDRAAELSRLEKLLADARPGAKLLEAEPVQSEMAETMIRQPEAAGMQVEAPQAQRDPGLEAIKTPGVRDHMAALLGKGLVGAQNRDRLRDISNNLEQQFTRAADLMTGVPNPTQVKPMAGSESDREQELLARDDMARREAMAAKQMKRQQLLDEARAAMEGKKFDASETERARQADLEERRFAEAARHNRAAEGISRAAASRSGPADNRLESDVQKAGSDFADITGLNRDMSVLQAAAAGTGGIPGVGVWDSRKPAFMQSAEDTEIDQATKGALAKLIKLQSGAVASENEVRRKQEELGFGPGKTEQQFRGGVKKLAEEIEKASKNTRAKYRPEVVETYRARGGEVDLASPTKGGGAAKPSAQERIAQLKAEGKSKDEALKILKAEGYGG